MRKILLSVVCLAIAGMVSTSCNKKSVNTVEFSLYGTDMKVRFDASLREAMKDNSQEEVRKCLVWIKASTTATLADCQRIKQELNLSDWAYVKMLERFAIASLDSTNEAVLLMYDMLTRSGYGALVSTYGNGQLKLWYQTDALIYNNPSIELNSQHFFLYGDTVVNGETAMLDKMEGKPIDFRYQGEMKLAQKLTEPRTITSKKDSTFTFTVQMNQNLIDYYKDVPPAAYDENFMTRWTTMAGYEFEQSLKDSLIAQMKKRVTGLSQIDAVQELLWWVQTGLDFEYDEKVWGRDRYFYPEETLYYPYADAEDRSVLFARLIKDVMGLDVALVYYPVGHVAAAVCITEAVVKGDFLKLEDDRFVICDPTYVGAYIGETMPGMKNDDAKIMSVGELTHEHEHEHNHTH